MSGLEQSRVLLMMLSENFDDSDWAEYESGMFLFRDPKNTERRFIPVRLDTSPIRESLRQFAYLDWSKRDDHAYQLIVPHCQMSSKILKLLKRGHENASQGTRANPLLASICA